jgi:N-acetylmuramoyl-L-alanine amidase
MSQTDPTASLITSITAMLVLTMRIAAIVTLAGIVLATLFTFVIPLTKSSNTISEYDQSAYMANVQVDIPSSVAPTETKRPSQLIGIVAGHKGNDSGAVCPDGLTEASVNLDIATRVISGLEAAGYQVDLLDEFDLRLVGYDALAVLSIHNDSCVYVNDQATGFKVAGAVNTGTQGETQRLVTCLIDRYQHRTGLLFHANSITPDMTQYHTFYEVNSSTPVAIIEAGFLYLDREILTEQTDLVAQGIIEGILCYTMNQPLSSPMTPAP